MCRICAVVLAGLIFACDPESPEPPPRLASWPAGTVLAVDDVTLSAAQVQPWAEAVGLLYPEYTPVHCRRLALTNVLLPRAAARARFGTQREEARLRCEATFESLDPLGPAHEQDGAHQAQGTWRQLGLEMWHFARHLPVGSWSAPSDLTGRWVLVQLEQLVPGRAPEEEELVLHWLEFPYLDPTAVDTELRAAIDSSRLVVVDPAWNEAVPENWKQRMKEEG